MPEEPKEPLHDQETGEEIRPTPEYTKREAERLPEPETEIEAEVAGLVEKSEELAETPVVEAFDTAVTKLQEAADTLEPEQQKDSLHAIYSHDPMQRNTAVVFGRAIKVEGGIYTVVFGFLAFATLIEVVLGGFRAQILIPILLGIAVVKAGLVVAYYMHLRTDTRLFTYILLMPLGLALTAMLYLLAVPPTGY